MDDPTDISQAAVADVHAAARRITDCAEELDLPDLAAVLADAEDAYRTFRKAIDAVKEQALDRMARDNRRSYEADSLPAPLVISRSGASPQWNGRETARRVAAQVADEVYDRDTGEVPPLGVVCATVADAIVDCAGLTPSKAWRKDSLRARHIDLDGLVKNRAGTLTVRFAKEQT